MKIKVLVMYLCIVLLINFAYIFSVEAYVEDRAYSVGDKIILDNELYYTIAPSNSYQRYVTVMKDDPLKQKEINQYGEGRVNEYTYSPNGVAHGVNYYGLLPEEYRELGYGTMAYYSTESCSHNNTIGCTTDFKKSDIKYMLDNWSNAKSFSSILTEIDGYKVRLITLKELMDNLGYNNATWAATNYEVDKESTPSWVYNTKYCEYYWTMSPYNDSLSDVFSVEIDGDLHFSSVSTSEPSCVRPVVNVLKDSVNDISKEDSDSKKNDNIMTTIVKVTDTFIEKSFIPSIIGGIGLVVGLIIYGIIRYRSNKN